MRHAPRYVLALLALLGGCAAKEPAVSDQSKQQAPATAPAERFTGTLHGGVIAVGAETTGWVLERDGMGGGTRVDVDVSRVLEDALPLEGKRVVIEGTMTKANWVERGEKDLLIADRIEPE